MAAEAPNPYAPTLDPRLPPGFDDYWNKRDFPSPIPRTRRRDRARGWMRARTEQAQAAFHITLTMARWAIHMTTRGERDPRIRAQKENQLLEKWKRFQERAERIRHAARTLSRY